MNEGLNWPAFWTSVILFISIVGLLILMLLALGSGVPIFRVGGYILGTVLFGTLFGMLYKLCCIATERLKSRGEM